MLRGYISEELVFDEESEPVFVVLAVRKIVCDVLN